MTSATAALAPAPDPDQTKRVGAVAMPERRRLFLMVDPALILDGGISHSGACLYAALAYMWFENITDTGKLRELEQRSGRKRFDPIVVTADQLRELTGLKKDGVAARIRELEQPHPCIWRGCAEPHPMITVRRLGQGRGLQVRRFLCGDSQPVPRKRVRLTKAIPSATPSELWLDGDDGQKAAPPRSPMEAQSAETAPKTRQKAASPRSGRNASPTAENAAVTPSKTRDSRSLEHGSDAFKKAAAPRFLRGKEDSQKTQAANNAAAAANEFEDEKKAELALIESRILDLGRLTQPGYGEDAARRLGRRLIAAALDALGEPNVALRRLEAALGDPRVKAAENPLALLVRGVVGDRRRPTEPDRFLLEVTQVPTKSLPPGLKEMLAEYEAPLDARWLRERDLTLGAAGNAQRLADELSSTHVSGTPLCDRLESEDPAAYRTRMQQIFEGLGIDSFLGQRPSIGHPMFRGMCRARLERELAQG